MLNPSKYQSPDTATDGLNTPKVDWAAKAAALREKLLAQIESSPPSTTSTPAGHTSASSLPTTTNLPSHDSQLDQSTNKAPASKMTGLTKPTDGGDTISRKRPLSPQPSPIAGRHDKLPRLAPKTPSASNEPATGITKAASARATADCTKTSTTMSGHAPTRKSSKDTAATNDTSKDTDQMHTNSTNTSTKATTTSVHAHTNPNTPLKKIAKHVSAQPVHQKHRAPSAPQRHPATHRTSKAKTGSYFHGPHGSYVGRDHDRRRDRDRERLVAQDHDLWDWLAYTGWNDEGYRARFLDRQRRLADIDRERAALLDADQRDVVTRRDSGTDASRPPAISETRCADILPRELFDPVRRTEHPGFNQPSSLKREYPRDRKDGTPRKIARINDRSPRRLEPDRYRNANPDEVSDYDRPYTHIAARGRRSLDKAASSRGRGSEA